MQWYPIFDTSDEALEAVAEEFVISNEGTNGATERGKSIKEIQNFASAGDNQEEGGPMLEGLLSDHAEMRLCQRGLSLEDIAYILSNGACEQIAAATIYYLRSIDIPSEERSTRKRLVGTAVITAPDRDQIITIWRNRKHGLRNLRHKRQRRWRLPTAAPDKAA